LEFRRVLFRSHVALRLAVEPLADDAALHLASLASGQRPVVDAERHRKGWRIDRLGGDRRIDLRMADRVGDARLREPGDGHDVSGHALVDRLPLEAAEGEHPRYPP